MRPAILLLALFTTIGVLAACQPVRRPPALAVTPSKPEDQVQVHWEGDGIVVEIASPSGIGAAHIQLPPEPATATLRLRLRLAALEGLQVSSSARQVALSVDNVSPYTVRSQGNTQDLEQSDIEVERCQNHFTITLGRTWLQGDSLEVRWIDFYR